MIASRDRARFVADMLAWINRRLAPPGLVIEAETPLFAGGLINSMRILEVIAWTERATGRAISDRDISMANFTTVVRIAEVFLVEAVHADR